VLIIYLRDREHQRLSSLTLQIHITIYPSRVSKAKGAGVCKGVKGDKTLHQQRSFYLQIKAAVAVRVWEQYLPFSLRLVI